MPVTAPTITPTLTGTGNRAVSLTITDYGSATTYRVWREVNGVATPAADPRYFVRGAIDQAVGSPTVIDVDFPQNSTVTYWASCTDGVTTQTSAESAAIGPIDLGADYIGAITAAADGVPVVVGQMDAVGYESRTEVVKVLNRRDPVAVSDLRAYPSFTLTVWSLTTAYRDALEGILVANPVILFSPRYPAWAGSKTAMYLAVTNVREVRASSLGGVVERKWELECAQVATPKVPVVSSLSTSWTASPSPVV